MTQLQQYKAAQSLEIHLGDPLDPENEFSFARSVELDEREEYPAAACRMLDEWGLQDYYVPSARGGKLGSYEEFLALLRVVARRDLTAAIAHAKTYLGAVAAWVGGGEGEQRRLARSIMERKQVALALTEKAHGSDLLATEVRATKAPGGYVLDGSKWLINNATRSAIVTVFARTDEAGGPRGFSFFVVRKGELERGSYAHAPKIRTHGIRGADISGISFEKCFVPASSLLGEPGAALETILKGFQITRTFIPGLSLGAADTALRSALDFAASRRLYGASVFDIPHARRQLVDAFVDLLICECTATAAARSLHVAPEQMSVASAVTKYFVPTAVEEIFRALAVVLGARHYLREGHWHGTFQKFLRDNAILGLFDGSTVVNLSAIALQLPQLAATRAKLAGRGDEDEKVGARLSSCFTLSEPLPDFDPSGLTLHNRGRDLVLEGLRLSAERLPGLGAGHGVDAEALAAVRGLALQLLEEADAHRALLEKTLAGDAHARGKSPELFDLAKDYCALYAGAACLHTWLHNREGLGEYFARGEWLALALRRVLLRIRGGRAEGLNESYFERAAQELERLHAGRSLFSIDPRPLAA